jgi:hypothetical protein
MAEGKNIDDYRVYVDTATNRVVVVSGARYKQHALEGDAFVSALGALRSRTSP